MSLRSARWLCFAGLFMLLPWPLLLVLDCFVPAVRYLILALTALLVMLVEGGAGPVPGVVLLFSLHALLYTAAAWALAWGSTQLIARWAPRALAPVVLLSLAIGLAIALLFEPYQTSFGRAARGGLLDILS